MTYSEVQANCQLNIWNRDNQNIILSNEVNSAMTSDSLYLENKFSFQFTLLVRKMKSVLCGFKHKRVI